LWLLQKLNASDIITPDEFEYAVRSAFVGIRKEAGHKVRSDLLEEGSRSLFMLAIEECQSLLASQVECIFEELWVVYDFTKWLKGQGNQVFPTTLQCYAKRDDTCHQFRVTRSLTHYSRGGEWK